MREAPECAGRVAWLDQLPAVIDGAVIANEVLDALPAHVIARRRGEWLECGVAWDPAAAHIAWADRPASAALIALASERFPPDADYTSEINLAAEALVEDLGRRIAHGALLAIDYGFPAAEYYHPERNRGTLMGHYRHRAHDDPFLWPGLSDVTAHVDFTAIARAGERAGLAVGGFTTQAAFLLGCGILDALAATGPVSSAAYLKAAAPVQRLLSPAEMGELFKVLALAKSERIEWPGFAVADRSHRL
jgi:SAM-dependent MidA family methyltransferase